MANPCHAMGTSKILKRREPTERVAFTEPADVSRLLKAIDEYAKAPEVSIFVGAALRLHPLLFCRPGELIAMKWADVDLNDKQWRYLMTKKGRPVIVPLSRQATEILRGLEQYRDGSEYVFPNRARRGRHMSNMTLNRALQTLGIDTKEEHTSHGWRSTARTLISEKLKRYRSEVVEFQLHHFTGDPLKYNRAQYLDERIPMMQDWSDYCDKLKVMGFDESDNDQ